MSREEIAERVTNVFREVFNDDTLVLTDTTTAADVPGWDSLRHITLMEEVEEEMDIRFTMLEINCMKNVGEMFDIIQARAK